MRHTFICEGGIRLEIQLSKTKPGHLLLSIAGACVTLPPSTAAVIAGALEMEAVAAENLAQSVRLAGGLAAAVSGTDPAAGGCDCKASRHVGNYPPPCVCHESRLTYMRSGLPVMSLLPVVDVAQVGA